MSAEVIRNNHDVHHHRPCFTYDKAGLDAQWNMFPNLREIIPEYASTEISSESVMHFLQTATSSSRSSNSCVIIKSDKKFGTVDYMYILQARKSAYALAVEYMMNNHVREAFYLLLYVSSLDEILQRGPDTIRAMLEFELSLFDLGLYFGYFSNAISVSRDREMMWKYINMQLDLFMGIDQSGMDDLAVLLLLQDNLKNGDVEDVVPDYSPALLNNHRLMSMYQDHSPPHSLPLLDIEKEQYRVSVRDFMMNITLRNTDNDTRQKRLVYKDVTLGWLLKTYIIRCVVHSELCSPGVTEHTKYFQVIHHGKILYVSTSSEETLHDLGIKDGDELLVGGADSSDEEEENKLTSLARSRPRRKKGSRKKSNKVRQDGPEMKRTHHQEPLPTTTATLVASRDEMNSFEARRDTKPMKRSHSEESD